MFVEPRASEAPFHPFSVRDVLVARVPTPLGCSPGHFWLTRSVQSNFATVIDLKRGRF